MGFDKISSILKKTIITSKSNPYEYFYEYIKNGFSIIQVPKLIYDRDKQDFKFHQNKYINSGVNRIYENKIKKLGLSNLVK